MSKKLAKWDNCCFPSSDYKRRKFIVTSNFVTDRFGVDVHVANGQWNPNVVSPGGEYFIFHGGREYGWCLGYRNSNDWWIWSDDKEEWHKQQ